MPRAPGEAQTLGRERGGDGVGACRRRTTAPSMAPATMQCPRSPASWSPALADGFSPRRRGRAPVDGPRKPLIGAGRASGCEVASLPSTPAGLSGFLCKWPLHSYAYSTAPPVSRPPLHQRRLQGLWLDPRRHHKGTRPLRHRQAVRQARQGCLALPPRQALETHPPPVSPPPTIHSQGTLATT